jgi:uncharacterized membrane protein YgdD (TMEM256/DUF423 family)
MAHYRSIWWTLGAWSGASAVAMGAFGAHGLRNHVTDVKLLDAWKTAAQYQLAHSLALMIGMRKLSFNHPLYVDLI